MPSKTSIRIAERIRYEMYRKGVTARKLSEECKCTVNTIRSVLRAENVGCNTRDRICEYLKIELLK